MRIILATNNQGKVLELKQKLAREVFSLKDINLDIEIIEDGDTLLENAMIKVKAISKLFPNDIVIADDTGLFVEELNGRPGVHSARYAFDGCTNEDNIDKLLKELEEIENRNAYFETVIAVYKDGEYYNFSGRLDGKILEKRLGDKGFGYDKVFYATEVETSLACVTSDVKNQISHRARALDNLNKADII